jgi:hypothetical protein
MRGPPVKIMTVSSSVKMSKHRHWFLIAGTLSKLTLTAAVWSRTPTGAKLPSAKVETHLTAAAELSPRAAERCKSY